MGIEILSFTIKDIEDHVDYLDSLGKTQTAKVKRDADIGVAESNRDAGIRVCILQMKIQPTRHKDCWRFVCLPFCQVIICCICVSMRSYLTLSLPGVINKEFLSIMSKSREVMRRRKILYCVSKDQVLRTRIISKIWERVHWIDFKIVGVKVFRNGLISKSWKYF